MSNKLIYIPDDNGDKKYKTGIRKDEMIRVTNYQYEVSTSTDQNLDI